MVISHQTLLHFNLLAFAINFELFVCLGSGNLVDSLDNSNSNLMPVGSLESHEIGKEEKEVANRGSDPCPKNWNFFEFRHVKAQ